MVLSSTSGVKGCINTNGEPRRLKLFNKLSSYIMQEDLLEPFVTVKEAMKLAAHLKLGNELTPAEKDTTVNLLYFSIKKFIIN